MPDKRRTSERSTASLLTDLLITQLGAAGVRQQAIREIVGCDINRVSRILKHIKAARKKPDQP